MSSLPRPNSHLGLPGQVSFLPLSPEPSWQVLSTRGQSLPGLIRRYSMPDVAGRYDAEMRAGDIEEGEDAYAYGNGYGYAKSNSSLNSHSHNHSHGHGHGHGHINKSRDDASADFESEIESPPRRSSLLIGDTTSLFRWQEYYTPPEQLAKLRKPVRKYYERMNFLVSRYSYVDRLLDSSIARDLIEDYERQWAKNHSRLQPIAEESLAFEGNGTAFGKPQQQEQEQSNETNHHRSSNRVLSERTPLLLSAEEEADIEETASPGSSAAQETRRIILTAIYVNLLANVLLLAAKIIITVMTSSVSVLASLVDAALDFLSTAIIWSTTRLTARRDRHRYPIGRRRLEPVGVLIFSTVMITSFVQVALVSLERLSGEDHNLVRLTGPAIAIMAATVAVKGLCWVWCRRINDSNVQALAQDAMTDIVFNLFSIIFPLAGTYTNRWFLDSTGGLVLSIYVIGNWAGTAQSHIAHLTGSAASPDERSVFLYLVMRFAASIRWIQNLEAYHAGDRLNVEVDIVLDADMSLHDSHDVGESLQYMLESVASVDRAFVHLDYVAYNLPTHIDQ